MMEEVRQNNKKNSLFYHNGFSYHQDKRCREIYRCSLRKKASCHGILIGTKGNTVTKYVIKTAHNHEPIPHSLQLMKLKINMLSLCRTTLRSSKQIFDDTCRMDPEAAKSLSFVSMKSILNRERAMHRPAVPKTIAALSDLIQVFEPVKCIYKGSVTADDGKMALIFSTAELLEALDAASEILVDGIFSVVPRFPPMVQLYSVHIRYLNTGIAIVFILTEARTTALYRAIWRKLLELAPGLQRNVKRIMTDYEKAAITAMSEYLPNAEIHGCWFHYNQAVLRKWRRLGLSKAPRELVSMAMTIPLTPHTFFTRCFSIIQSVAIGMTAKYPRVKEFMKYMRTVWLPIAKKVSVYGCPVRTNNIVESFHNTATTKLGGMHPGLWDFFERLRQLIVDNMIDLGRVGKGHQIRRIRTRVNRNKEEKVLQLQEDLINKKIQLKDFLKSFQPIYDRQYQEEETD